VALDAAVLTLEVGRLAELDEVVLAREALPASLLTHGGSMRPEDSCGEQLVTGAYRWSCKHWASRSRSLYRGRLLSDTSTCRCSPRRRIDRARHAQVGRQRDHLGRVRQVLADGGSSARRVADSTARGRAVGGSTDIVDHVRAGVLVASHVGFDRVPVNSGKVSLKLAVPVKSVSRLFAMLPSRRRTATLANGMPVSPASARPFLLSSMKVFV